MGNYLIQISGNMDGSFTALIELLASLVGVRGDISFVLQFNAAKINILILHDCMCVSIFPASGTNSQFPFKSKHNILEPVSMQSALLNEKQNINKVDKLL